MPELAYHAYGLSTARSLKEAEPYIHALKKDGSREAVRHLLIDGHSKVNGVYDASCKALLKMPKESTIKELIDYGLNHENIDIVCKSAALLADIGDKKALPHIMKLTGEYDSITNDILKMSIKKLQEVNRGKKR